MMRPQDERRRAVDDLMYAASCYEESDDAIYLHLIGMAAAIEWTAGDGPENPVSVMLEKIRSSKRRLAERN